MSDTSKKSGKGSDRDSQSGPESSPREDAAEHLRLVLDEAHWARVRAETRTRPLGYHGENFERRASVVEHIVQKFNERAVKKARKNALQAGWTQEQLASAGLAGDQNGSGNARA